METEAAILLSTKQVAARKGVTVETVNRWARTGKLEVAREELISGARLYDPDVVDAFSPRLPDPNRRAARHPRSVGRQPNVKQ